MKLLNKFVYLALFSSAYFLEGSHQFTTEQYLETSDSWLKLLQISDDLQNQIAEQIEGNNKSPDQILVIDGLQFYNPKGLSVEKLLNQLKFDLVDQAMRKELLEVSNEQILEARRVMLADTKQEGYDHMEQRIVQKLKISNFEAEKIVHNLTYRIDNRNIMRQNGVIFHKLIETQINKHREAMSEQGVRKLMLVAQKLSFQQDQMPLMTRQIAGEVEEMGYQNSSDVLTRRIRVPMSKEDREVRLIVAYTAVRDEFRRTWRALVEEQIEQLRDVQMNHFHRYIAQYIDKFDKTLLNVDAHPDVKSIDVQKLYASLTKERTQILLDQYQQRIDEQELKKKEEGTNSFQQ